MCWNRKKDNAGDAAPQINENYIPDKATNNDCSVNIVFIGVIIVMALIIVASCIMFYNSCSYETEYKKYEDKWIETRDSLFSESIPVDSVLISVIPIKEKPSNVKETNPKMKDEEGSQHPVQKDARKYIVPLSDIAKIRESQKLIFMRQDQLIDDLRQETNNIINKMNGWLGFWMAVMAILGVFVPIALQIKLYRENRDNDARLRQEYREEFEHLREEAAAYVSKCETALRDEQAKITGELLKMEIDTDKQFKELQKDYQTEYQKDKDELQRIKFAAVIRNFHNISDSPEIKTTEARDELLKKNWSEILYLVRKFIEQYVTESSPNGNTYEMSVVIVQVISVMTTLRILSPNRKRKLENIISESYGIIKELNSPSRDRKKIIKRLNNYNDSLLDLAPFTL